jgi:hypothetical protein
MEGRPWGLGKRPLRGMSAIGGDIYDGVSIVGGNPVNPVGTVAAGQVLV